MSTDAIQAAPPEKKPIDTSFQAGEPTPPPAQPPRPETPPGNPAYRALVWLADLRITVFLFALAMLIVFWGTLAQVDFGVWTVVARYFRSAFVWVPLRVVLFLSIEDNGLAIPFPGGWLIGGAMLINLLAAHAVRFKLAWNRTGILMIHAGLIVIMLGELVTGLFSVESQMVIPVGQTVNQVVLPGTAEFAVIRIVGEKEDSVVAVPKTRLRVGQTIDDPKLPFKVEILQYMVNSEVFKGRDRRDPEARGNAANLVAKEVREVAGVDPNARHDAPSMYVKLTTHDGKDLGKRLFSAHLDPEWIKVDGVDYQVALRFKHENRPFSFHLTEFKHDVFPGTNTPKDFHSYVVVNDKEAGVDRPVEIYMNAPFYYRGETFYQSSWTTDPMSRKANGTVLQVVHNPGWLMPYLACALVGFGMLIHFGNILNKFVNRRVVR